MACGCCRQPLAQPPPTENSENNACANCCDQPTTDPIRPAYRRAVVDGDWIDVEPLALIYDHSIEITIAESTFFEIFGSVDGELFTEGRLVFCREILEGSLAGVDRFGWLKLRDNSLLTGITGVASLFVEPKASQQCARHNKDAANEECARDGGH